MARLLILVLEFLQCIEDGCQILNAEHYSIMIKYQFLLHAPGLGKHSGGIYQGNSSGFP